MEIGDTINYLVYSNCNDTIKLIFKQNVIRKICIHGLAAEVNW